MYGFQNEDNVMSDEILFAKHAKDQRCDFPAKDQICVFPIEFGIVSSDEATTVISPRSLDSFGNS